jgi:tetratricopeptide (TPR) repeat protein
MRASICVFYIAALAASGPLWAQSDPDALYRERTDIAKAHEAVAIWDARLAKDPKDFESAWKLARAAYWLGGHDDPAARRADLEKGVEAGRTASVLQPGRPEGFFWMAASMGQLAESFGMRQGLKYRGPIKDALETVLRIDAAYQNGSADRALGRWYFKVPGLFGGSKKKSEEHLRASLTYDTTSHASRFFLAETLFELGRKNEAIAELQKVIDGPVHRDWEPEDREFKKQAADRLAKERR